MRNIILLAVQGARKGTVATALREKYNYVHISTGDLLRKRALTGDELGNEIADLIHNGVLVSDDIVFEILEERLNKQDCAIGYILDGIPRTLEQAKRYDELAKTLSNDVGIVINMDVPDEVVIDRITSRKICHTCEKIYNMRYQEKRPRVEGVCDDCGGEVRSRDDDDNEDAIRKRIKTYHENAKAIIDFYREKGNLFTVDAHDSKHAISEIEKIKSNWYD